MTGRREPDEAGFSLIEVLVATVVMGTAVIALVIGLGTVINSNEQTREATTAAIVARGYAESVEVAAEQPVAWCSTSYSTSYTPPAGYTVTPTFGACPANTATTPQFQTVQISVASPSGATEKLTMVVRKP